MTTRHAPCDALSAEQWEAAAYCVVSMFLWINGAFSGGDTHVAAEIAQRLPGTWIADPELAGFGLHRMLPPTKRSDFQDMPSWHAGVLEALDAALIGNEGLVIAPQTLVCAEYLQEILGTLRHRGHDVRHVAPLAKPETVIRRLHDRSMGRFFSLLGVDVLARESFAVERVESYLDPRQRPEFVEHIWTDNLTVPEVAEQVATACDLDLLPREPSQLKTTLRTARTNIRHIRRN